MLGRLYHKSLFLVKGLKRSSVNIKFFSTKKARKQPKKEKTGIWAVELREAHPDYKRPFATFSVKYFRSKKSAKEYKKELLQDLLKRVREWVREENEEKDEDVDEKYEEYTPKSEQQLLGDYAEKLFESQGYMDMKPYNISIYEIKLPKEDANIEKELSSAPK